jgi:hypothetical protein
LNYRDIFTVLSSGPKIFQKFVCNAKRKVRGVPGNRYT